MTIFRFSSEALARPMPSLDLAFLESDILSAAADAISHFAISEEQPIVVSDEWELDELLCDFANHIMATEQSELTALTYAREAEVFARFIQQRHGRSLRQVKESDLWEYRKERLRGNPSFRLQPTTWNKVTAVLLRLLRYLKIHFSEITWKTLRASLETDDRVRMISVPDYLRFRDDGMAAKRNPMRNSAFSDFLVTSGVRCSEGSALLRSEIPNIGGFGNFNCVTITLPALITKGGKRRDVLCSKRVVRDFIQPYIEEERSHVTASAIERLFPQSTYSLQVLESHTDHIFFLREGRKLRLLAGEAEKILVPAHKLSKRERQMLVEVVPSTRPGRYRVVDFGYLWVSETGSCVTPSSWLSNFETACLSVGPEDDPSLLVTPHVLRHTFAVHQLNFMLRRLLDIRSERGRITRRGEVYARIVGDPLRRLQLLLGHKHIGTTYKYLTYVEDNVELVTRATEEWDSLLEVAP